MKKVCVITTSLGRGGAERSSALLSQMLFELNFEVHIISTKNDIDYEYAGTLFNLEEELGTNLTSFKKIIILRQYFKKHDFDIVIDNRTRPVFLKEYFLYNYVFKARKIFSVVRNFYLERYFPNNRLLAKILYNNKTVLVAVSKEIQNAISEKFGLNNVKQIYNPIQIKDLNNKANESIDVENESYILWYGRIDEHAKNFALLLNAYKNSILLSKNVKLYIIGQGDDLNLLKSKINTLKLNDYVTCLPFFKNPFPYVKRAKFVALTSYYEGFPRVLIESLACGTPVVSVDCKSGPKEIIQHGFNGLLVENHNVKALAKAFNSFIEDESLYNKCKANAKNSVERFSGENITEEWRELLV